MSATPTSTVPQVYGDDQEIVLGTHADPGPPETAYGFVPSAVRAYFDYVNEELGGVCGRRISLVGESDNSDPAVATKNVRKLLDQDKVMAIIGGAGDATHSAVVDYLNEEGVPDLWIMSGLHKWAADQDEYPWSISLLPDYFVEGTIMGRYISQELPGKRVGVLYQDDDFGKDGLAGIKNGLDPNSNEIASIQSHEITAIDVADQVAKLKEDGAEVVALYSWLGFTAQAISHAHRLGWRPQFVAGAINADPLVFQFVQPQLLEGTISLGAFKMVDSIDDPAIARHREIMHRASGLTPGSISIYGETIAALAVEVLSRACDNLTRDGFMDAVEELTEYQSDLLLDGVTITLSEADHLAIEQMRTLKATVVDGKGKWEYFGPIREFR